MEIEKSLNDMKRKENNRKELKEKFDKLSEQYLLQGVLARKIRQFIKDNKDNAVLSDYLKMMNNIDSCQSLIKQYKDDLYEVMEREREKSISNEFIEVTCKYSYKRSGFDEKSYFKDNPISEEVRQKYLTETICKGNVTIKEKRKL